MEPRREPFRNPRDRYFSNLPPTQSDSRPNPISIFTAPKITLNLNSRPFILNSLVTRGPPLQIPLLGAPLNPHSSHSHSQAIQALNPLNNLPAPSREQVKCQYCNESFAEDAISEHIDDCDLRKISCDKCGDRILIDIFDLHFEECAMDNNMELGDPRSAMYIRHVDEMEDDDDSMEDEEINLDDNRRMFLPESNLTYEQLLQLDNNVVKKGMDTEQLKEFPVQLYVRSLDGEGSCAICISEYETGEYVRKLSCVHKFHRNCVDKWLETNITCPVCKKYLR